MRPINLKFHPGIQCIDWMHSYLFANKVSITADVAKNVFEAPNLGSSVLTACKVTFLQINLVLLQM
jgi:hypothetical protein